MTVSLEDLGARTATRGRLVILTDNAVIGDSRVQKQAKSAAEAGWDVVLLGRSKTTKLVRWTISGAAVVLVPVPTALGRGAHQVRRGDLRSPFAYPPGPLARFREQEMHARQGEKVMAAARASQDPTAAHRSALAVTTIINGARNSWVRLRLRQTRRLAEARRVLDAPLDRATTALWSRTMGERSWRRLDPSLVDLDIAYRDVLDALKPDLIHANDFRTLGIGARAALRGRASGRNVGLVWDAHEDLHGIKPWASSPRWRPAQIAHESEYASEADAVVTVSDELAGILRSRYGLRDLPTVVLNAPSMRDLEAAVDTASLRSLCGVTPATPLAVYSGTAAPQRGLELMVRALPEMPELHVALVVSDVESAYPKQLRDLAFTLGVDPRLHLLPYVPHEEVVSFLSEADVGVIPLHHWPNHEIALITKFFEYSHARLPILVSDVRTMAEQTRATGQGEVFVAEDLPSYVAGMRRLLADPGRYRAAYEAPGLLSEWTWERQAELLDQVYARVLVGVADR